MPTPRLAWCLLLVSACQDAPGELDRDVVNDLSRTRGDAAGTARTGRYLVRVRAESCECPIYEATPLAWASACAPLLALGGEIVEDAEIVESDGFLLVRLPTIGVLTGPIEQDGEFSVGGVIDLSSPVSRGAIIVRGDGSFLDTHVPPPDEPYTRWAMEGLLQRRLVGELLEETTDCTEQLFIEDARP